MQKLLNLNLFAAAALIGCSFNVSSQIEPDWDLCEDIYNGCMMNCNHEIPTCMALCDGLVEALCLDTGGEKRSEQLDLVFGNTGLQEITQTIIANGRGASQKNLEDLPLLAD